MDFARLTMTHETGLLLLQSGWIYIGLTVAVIVVFLLSRLYGSRARRKINKEAIEVSSIFITSIFVKVLNPTKLQVDTS